MSGGSGGVPVPPTFTAMVGAGSDIAGIMSLDDIFGTEDGGGGFPLAAAGGGTKRKAETKSASMDYESDDFDDFEDNVTEKKRSRGAQRNMTEEQKVERR